MSPDDPRHGESAGYVAGCREECCRTAIADWTRHARTRRYLQGQLMVDGTGTRRRIQALMALGWPSPTIDAELGRKRTYTTAILCGDGAPVLRTTAEQYRRLYDRLSMTLPPQETRYQKQASTRVRNHARRMGWAPPLAWDDQAIDDPNARPIGVGYVSISRDDSIRDLAEMGLGVTEACRRLHMSRDALERWCQRHDLSDVYRELAGREALWQNQHTREAS